MEELLFRSSQRIENLQVKTHLAFAKIKDILILLTERGNLLVLEVWNNPTLEDAKANMKSAALKLITSAKEMKSKMISYANPRQIYIAFVNIIGKKWTTRDICFACSGLMVGGLIGLSIGLTIRRKEAVLRYMKAIQCNNYLGVWSVTVVEDAFAPYECSEYDVLVNIKAVSVQIIDTQICNGYGRTLRRILQGIHSPSRCDLPVILGRDCTGIITDVGSKVTRLELGDEVWLTVPFWCQGTLCQSMLVSENRVARKPKNVGFEGACSLPYSGSLALAALAEAHIEPLNARQKR
ncbi:hypothetical protein JTB14_014571 [Gonioctena quinquepunctata]|nr:hypothetical protein JTB14_014571 [Gonioctena quinquepunctata]